MAEITWAWVYVPTMGINSKQMKFDEVRAFCKKHRLGVWKDEKVVNISDYPLGPVERPIMTYSFCIGSYLTSPNITLVPFGTTVDCGRFVFPGDF